jgi:hypothetical protein
MRPSLVRFLAVSLSVDRPLGLSELFAETIRLYGERIGAAVGLGLPVAGALAVTFWSHAVVDTIVVSLAFTLTYAAAARVAAGEGIAEAGAQAALRLPTLLVLTLVVAVPFALALQQLFLLFVAVAWLGVSGFSIPVAMLERDPNATDWFGRLGYTLYRSLQLARAEYLHAVGIMAALVITYAICFGVLVAALVGFGDNGRDVAALIATGVLAPFFFLGLSVLYFEQKVRALSSRRDNA